MGESLRFRKVGPDFRLHEVSLVRSHQSNFYVCVCGVCVRSLASTAAWLTHVCVGINFCRRASARPRRSGPDGQLWRLGRRCSTAVRGSRDRCLQVQPAGSRCATQLDRPDGMAVAEEVEQLELERDEAQELPMLLRPGNVGDGGAEEPEEHEQLSAGTAGRGRDVDGFGRRLVMGRCVSVVRRRLAVVSCVTHSSFVRFAELELCAVLAGTQIDGRACGEQQQLAPKPAQPQFCGRRAPTIMHRERVCAPVGGSPLLLRSKRCRACGPRGASLRARRHSHLSWVQRERGETHCIRTTRRFRRDLSSRCCVAHSAASVSRAARLRTGPAARTRSRAGAGRLGAGRFGRPAPVFRGHSRAQLAVVPVSVRAWCSDAVWRACGLHTADGGTVRFCTRA